VDLGTIAKLVGGGQVPKLNPIKFEAPLINSINNVQDSTVRVKLHLKASPV